MTLFSRPKRGFTLIELLVVIAIIGILSSVVLASLVVARLKGNDAEVKSNLNNARSQAELFSSENNNLYVGAYNTASDVCAPGALASGVKGIYTFIKAAADAQSVPLDTEFTDNGSTNKATCHAAQSDAPFKPNTWAAEVPLKGTYPGYANPMWCVDSNGSAVVTSGSTLAGSDPKCN